jgi:hypothetical protein
MSDNIDFDKQSAWLRRFKSDAESNLKAFALRLKEAMPEQVELIEEKTFFGKARLTGVSVEIGDNRYVLEIAGKKLKASKSMIVKGIKLSTKDIDPAEWFAQLSAETQKSSEYAKSLSQSISAFMAN